MKKSILFLVTILCLLFLTACSSTQETSKVSKKIIDANQFSLIKTAELRKIMGEPEKIEGIAGMNPSTKEKVSGKVYIYQKNKYDFIIFDDKVVRMNVYSDKYNNSSKESIAFNDEKDIFSMFGITPSGEMQKVADTGYALRWKRVSDKVADVWIVDLDKEKKTFDNAKIIYSSYYL